MQRRDSCFFIDVSDESLLHLLAHLPDACKSINPFLHCVICVEDPKKMENRLLRKISDVAVISGSMTLGKKMSCVAASNCLIVWRSDASHDPKREWMIGLISDLLKQNYVHRA